MKGPTVYTPDLGGIANGYTLQLGFSKKSWLGVEFVGAIKSDVLVMQIDDFYTPNSNPLFAGHQITVTDYYSNLEGLHRDSPTHNDISSRGYSNNTNYSFELTR